MYFVRLLILLAICGCICSCGGAPPSANSSTHSVLPTRIKVARSAGRFSNINAAEVDANLNAVNEILNTNDGAAKNGDGDFSFPIQLVRDGDILTPSSTMIPAVVQGESTIKDICDTRIASVYVVDRIQKCGRTSNTFTDGSIRGCSALGGKCMVVTRPVGVFTSDLEGILWAHEYIHTAGEDDSCTLACFPELLDQLMYPVIGLEHRMIKASEYNALMRLNPLP